MEHKNTELERFAYAASHDLREPLRQVESYVKLLAKRYKGRLDADAHDFINFAVMGVDRMNKLIRSTLTYARVGLGPSIFESVDCEDLLSHVLEGLKRTITETSAQIIRNPLPRVIGIPVLLTQVFQNLVQNAVKYHGPRNR